MSYTGLGRSTHPMMAGLRTAGIHSPNPLEENMPYVAFDQRELAGLYGTPKVCLRMGTPIEGTGRLSPVFERFLIANNVNVKNKTFNCNHLYINLNKRGGEHQDQNEKKLSVKKIRNFFPRLFEGKRSDALIGLNKRKDLGLVVITLPADGRFFLGEFSMKKGRGKKRGGKVSYANELLFDIKRSIRDDKNDFYMTKEVKEKLFGDLDKHDNGKLLELYQKALKEVLGPKGEEGDLNKIELNAEERNAVLFHFVKFKLTEYLIKELDPKSYNITCKEAVDRGMIHTLWYHMNLKYEKGQPMTKREFLKHLESAALIVKHRPMNDNRNLIWNVLMHRMKNDPKFAKEHEWAKQWVRDNAPSSKLAPIELSQPSIRRDTNKKEQRVSIAEHREKPEREREREREREKKDDVVSVPSSVTPTLELEKSKQRKEAGKSILPKKEDEKGEYAKALQRAHKAREGEEISPSDILKAIKNKK